MLSHAKDHQKELYGEPLLLLLASHLAAAPLDKFGARVKGTYRQVLGTWIPLHAGDGAYIVREELQWGLTLTPALSWLSGCT